MLEEVDQQPSFNITFLTVAYLVKFSNFFSQWLQGDPPL